MVEITQDEAIMLRESGRSDDVHMSSRTKKSRGKKYFMTESYKSIKLLNEYRKNKITEIHVKN